jgi:hypothetical protein
MITTTVVDPVEPDETLLVAGPPAPPMATEVGVALAAPDVPVVVEATEPVAVELPEAAMMAAAPARVAVGSLPLDAGPDPGVDAVVAPANVGVVTAAPVVPAMTPPMAVEVPVADDTAVPSALEVADPPVPPEVMPVAAPELPVVAVMVMAPGATE